jgi:hypothetical protein
MHESNPIRDQWFLSVRCVHTYVGLDGPINEIGSVVHVVGGKWSLWCLCSVYFTTFQKWKERLLQSGVYVMITIFCDFSQFSAKKLAFFLNTNVMINFFKNLALFCVKSAKFLVKFFGEKYFKNHNIGPWTMKFDRNQVYIRKWTHQVLWKRT